ncbi:TlpA disulfide reductase family protein [Marinicella meishanensis]|uniref:TlpA disulfide reductase family protein n=1 Tax=Marinicella meishanensis TaxID=2873263 RepID=UPI001CC17714|nr:TlpA disulfide reductase family protein [Marinicella sp. NBU2979]
MKNILPLMLIAILWSCSSSDHSDAASDSSAVSAESAATEQLAPAEPRLSGLWRGVLDSPGGELPFGIQLAQTADGYQAKILNGPEQVDTSAVLVTGSQVEIQFSWYDARLKATVDATGQSMHGEWSKTAADEHISRLPFTATKGYPYRFRADHSKLDASDVGGVWQVEFVDEDGPSVAVGEFQQSGTKVNGTFLTPTGDYRYLAGQVQAGVLRLSAFDGAHAFLFEAHLEGNQLTGDFWSRDTYHATWTAHRNDQAHDVLPDAWQAVKLTTDEIQFAFPDETGQLVRLSDPRFANKAVIINIFGTWCPNCNDEAPVLAGFYQQYRDQGLEIVGLAFEYTDDPVRDFQQIAAFRQRHGIDYPLLRAGQNDKAEAAQILGFVDQIVAYPTSLFLDRDHRVVNIHSGFAGPGTGAHYEQLVQQLEAQIQALLLE